MKIIILVFLLVFMAEYSYSQENKIPVEINNLSDKYEIIGELGFQLGTIVTVEGIVVRGPFKGYEGGLNLNIQKIDGLPTQKHIQIPVTPFYRKFGQDNLPKLNTGSCFRLRVYETGAYIGVPYDAFDEAGVIFQTASFYFRNELVVVSGEKIEKINWSPKEYLGKFALLDGVAQNENDSAIILSTNWKLKLSGARKWNANEVGKLVEVYGKVTKTIDKNTYIIDSCQARLVKLNDQLGKVVKLRGTARSLNGYWWFNYRGIDLYVEDMEKLPGWTSENHWQPMEITGILELDSLPRIDQISLKPERDLDLYFIVRKASWTPIDTLLEQELPPIKKEISIEDDE